MNVVKYIANCSNAILAIAILICVFTCMTYEFVFNYTDEVTAYTYYSIGNAIGYFLIATSVFSIDLTNGIKFIFFSLTLNNLLDELIFDNTKISYNEVIAMLFIVFIYYKKYYVGRRNIKS